MNKLKEVLKTTLRNNVNKLKEVLKTTLRWVAGFIVFMVALGTINVLSSDTPEEKAAKLVAQEIVCVESGYESCEDKQASEDEAKRVADEKQAEADRKAKEVRADQHCFSAWDGSHRGLESLIKRSLNDPDSYQHIETRFSITNGGGEKVVSMEYRARNVFGGMVVKTVRATTNNTTCEVIKIISHK